MPSSCCSLAQTREQTPADRGLTSACGAEVAKRGGRVGEEFRPPPAAAAPASALPPQNKGHRQPRPYLRAASPRTTVSFWTARHGRDWGIPQPSIFARLCSRSSARANAARPLVQSGGAQGSPRKGADKAKGGSERASLTGN